MNKFNMFITAVCVLFLQPCSQGLFPSQGKDPGNEVGKIWLVHIAVLQGTTKKQQQKKYKLRFLTSFYSHICLVTFSLIDVLVMTCCNLCINETETWPYVNLVCTEGGSCYLP